MTRPWNPATHDPILKSLHTGWKLTDPEIAERMGFPLAAVRDSRERLGLPVVTRPPARPRSQQRPDALAVAAEHLPDFDREAMTYRGRPIRLDEVMRKTNAVLVKKGQPQVDYNPAWRVRP